MQFNFLQSVETFFTFSYLEIVVFIIIGVPTILVMWTGAPFVPTGMKQVRRMLKVAKIKPGEKVYDLGSGDGRLVHTAAREHGAKAIGIEFSPLVWAWAKLVQPFWRSSAKIRFANMWKVDLSEADVIVCYLLPKPMLRMKKEIFPKLKPGTRIVSHAFKIPGVKPHKVLARDRDQGLSPVYVYKIETPKSRRKSK